MTKQTSSTFSQDSNSSRPKEMATNWPADEALANPDVWLGTTPHLHCLQRMALMTGNPGSTRLLISLKGQNVSREKQLVALIGKSPVADKVQQFVLEAQASLANQSTQRVQSSNAVAQMS